MEWEPISEAGVWDLINEGCSRMSLAEGRLWETIKIIPEKWTLSPYGDEGGGFWAVALIGRRVIWYNDIEEGFNISSYIEYGAIGEYKADQDELESAVQRIIFLIED